MKTFNKILLLSLFTGIIIVALIGLLVCRNIGKAAIAQSEEEIVANFQSNLETFSNIASYLEQEEYDCTYTFEKKHLIISSDQEIKEHLDSQRASQLAFILQVLDFQTITEDNNKIVFCQRSTQATRRGIMYIKHGEFPDETAQRNELIVRLEEPWYYYEDNNPI